MTIMLSESDFHALVDDLISAIETALDGCEEDIDFDIQSGILTIDCGRGGKIIINRQTANREVWLAAKSGGFHFRWDGASWRDTRTHEQLESVLSRVLGLQAGAVIPITL